MTSVNGWLGSRESSISHKRLILMSFPTLETNFAHSLSLILFLSLETQRLEPSFTDTSLASESLTRVSSPLLSFNPDHCRQATIPRQDRDPRDCPPPPLAQHPPRHTLSSLRQLASQAANPMINLMVSVKDIYFLNDLKVHIF